MAVTRTSPALADELAQRLAARPSRLARTGRWLGYFARHKPLGFISGCVAILVWLTAIGAFTGVIIPMDPIQVHGADRLRSFMYDSPRTGNLYILGTDDLGRDMLSRLLKGAQISVFFSMGVATLAITIGGTLGLVSAYIGGWFDMIVQRIVDGLQTVPFLVLAIAIVSILGPGIWQGFAAIAVVSIPRPTRLIRGSVLSAKENVWTEAARSIGCSDRRIMFRHILPNVTAPMLVLATFILATAVVTEASLSFLGIGAQPPTPSWGAMLTGSGRVYFQTHPRLAMLPGIAISIMVFATNMFGDALRDVLDPRLRGR